MRRFTRPLHLALLVLILLPSVAIPATPERRLALVIGNGAYPIGPLRNPVNDARDMAAALRELGFDVILREDATLRQMEDALDEFWQSLKKGGTGLFFFAGHGLQVKGVNYLVPVDARISVEQDVKSLCLDANRVLGRMENAENGLNILLLDACRNNPFARAWRSSEVGLAKMDAPTGTLIGYATAPDSVASDGSGRNGLYTQHLLREIRMPGQTIETALKHVRVSVLRDTGKKQIPWESSSLTGDFYFSQAGKGGGVIQAGVQDALQLSPFPVGTYDRVLDAQRRNDYVITFTAGGGMLAASTSGGTNSIGVWPKDVVNLAQNGNTLSFRLNYVRGFFGMGVKTYADIDCDLASGLETLGYIVRNENGESYSQQLVRRPPLAPPIPASKQVTQVPTAKQGQPNAGEKLKAPEIWMDPVTGMEFVWVPGGCFSMGSPATEAGHLDNEGPLHEVCVNGLWVGKYSVTVGQFRQFVSSTNYRTDAEKSGRTQTFKDGVWKQHDGMNWQNPGFPQEDRHPVVAVSWQDAQAFAEWLATKGNGKFRLMTEAEWEYAARAGTQSARYWGETADDICAFANAFDQSGRRVTGISYAASECNDGFAFTAPVGSFAPNAFGLYDMFGNAWQMCLDIYSSTAYTSHAKDNPVNTEGGAGRVIRGCAWNNSPKYVRAAYRNFRAPTEHTTATGFRLARTN